VGVPMDTQLAGSLPAPAGIAILVFTGKYFGIFRVVGRFSRNPGPGLPASSAQARLVRSQGPDQEIPAACVHDPDGIDFI